MQKNTKDELGLDDSFFGDDRSQKPTDTAKQGYVDDIIATGSFGRYQIKKEIGRGGMGRVYKAYDPDLDRHVALKLIIAKDIKQNDRERFLREAKATAKLNHPNIVSIYDIGKTNDQHFFTMDFIEGPTLKDIIEKNTLTIKQKTIVIKKIAIAIHYAHTKGVIHRDLKPSNIMIDQGKIPKVMDFGLAKLSRGSSDLSQTGMILGTLQYMPPEQANGHLEAIDARSDVYALGVILYEMLTGKPPFDGSITSILYQIMNDQPASFSQINQNIPKQLETICFKAMEKDQAKRYNNTKEFIGDLTRFIQGKQGKSRPQKVHVVLLALSLIFLLVGIFSWAKHSAKKEQRQRNLEKIEKYKAAKDFAMAFVFYKDLLAEEENLEVLENLLEMMELWAQKSIQDKNPQIQTKIMVKIKEVKELIADENTQEQLKDIVAKIKKQQQKQKYLSRKRELAKNSKSSALRNYVRSKTTKKSQSSISKSLLKNKKTSKNLLEAKYQNLLESLKNKSLLEQWLLLQDFSAKNPSFGKATKEKNAKEKNIEFTLKKIESAFKNRKSIYNLAQAMRQFRQLFHISKELKRKFKHKKNVIYKWRNKITRFYDNRIIKRFVTKKFQTFTDHNYFTFLASRSFNKIEIKIQEFSQLAKFIPGGEILEEELFHIQKAKALWYEMLKKAREKLRHLKNKKRIELYIFSGNPPGAQEKPIIVSVKEVKKHHLVLGTEKYTEKLLFKKIRTISLVKYLSQKKTGKTLFYLYKLMDLEGDMEIARKYLTAAKAKGYKYALIEDPPDNLEEDPPMESDDLEEDPMESDDLEEPE